MPIIPTPPNAIELVPERTLRAKVFDLGNGRRRIIQKIGKVHYVADDGTLQDIELETELDSVGDIVAHHSLPYRFRVHRRGVGLDYQSRTDGGKISLRLDRIGDREFNRNRKYTVTRQGRRITFTDLDDGLDIAFELARFGVRTYRVVKHAGAARSWRWEIECDEISEAKIRKSKIEGIDASDYSLDVVAKIGTATLLGDGRRRYYSEETWGGQVAKLDLPTRIKSWCDDVAWPVTIDPDITENIVADADDGWEHFGGGGWTFTGSRDDIGFYFVADHPAWRFQGVPLPAAADLTSIDLANLKINARSSTISGGGGFLYGYDTDDAGVLSDAGNKPTTMAKTTAKTTVAQSTSTGVRTYDITTLFDEWAQRAGRVDPADFTVFGIGTTGGYNRTRFEDYADAGTDEAQLEIDFTAAGGGGNRRRRSIICGA